MQEKTIDAQTSLVIKSKTEPINGVVLELIDLTITEVKVNEQPASFTHENGLINIPLSAPLQMEDSIVVEVHYNGHPFSENWGGFHFSGNYAFNLGVGFQSIPHNLGKTWFPCVDDFHDKATYDFYIQTPNNEKAICSGIRLYDIYKDGKVIYHWRMNHEIPTYLASVAIGDYEKYEDTYNGIEKEIPIEIWVRPSEINNVAGSFVNLKQVLNHYETHWGPYPFDRVGYVSTAIGAMEHPCNIAYPYGMINGNTTHERLYAHELAHMWFGDKVTCAAAEEMWLNEGWAVFNELFFREGLYPEEVWKQVYRNLHQEVLYKLHTSAGDGGYYALNNVPLEITYGKTTYDKGGLIVHTLRNYLGDELFFPAMKSYLNHYAYQSASSYDLMNYLTQETGINMQPFFENWVFTPGFPHYEIDSVVHLENNDYQVYVSQQGKGRMELFDDNIIEITFMNNAWEKYSDTLKFSGATGSKIFTLPFQPALSMMDFYDKMADATTDENYVVKEIGEINSQNTFLKLNIEQIIDSTFVRITHNWAAPDSSALDIADVTLSDYRFWKIDGIHKENFTASCKFFFSVGSSLDNTIELNDDYDIGLFYRKDKSEKWQIIPFTVIGNEQIGYLKVDDLQFGEYALASKKKGIGNEEIKRENSYFKVYPTPTDKNLNIKILDKSINQIQMIDEQGKVVERIAINHSQTNYHWNTSNIKPQTYIINGLKNDKVLFSEKIIINH